MSSLAAHLRARDRERLRALSPAARVRAALRLGASGLAAYCAARGVSLAAGRRALVAQRQAGRRPSACAQR